MVELRLQVSSHLSRHLFLCPALNGGDGSLLLQSVVGHSEYLVAWPELWKAFRKEGLLVFQRSGSLVFGLGSARRGRRIPNVAEHDSAGCATHHRILEPRSNPEPPKHELSPQGVSL